MVTNLVVLFVVCGFIFAGHCFADATADSNAVAIDTVWTLLAAFLVFFMQVIVWGVELRSE